MGTYGARNSSSFVNVVLAEDADLLVEVSARGWCHELLLYCNGSDDFGVCRWRDFADTHHVADCSLLHKL